MRDCNLWSANYWYLREDKSYDLVLISEISLRISVSKVLGQLWQTSKDSRHPVTFIPPNYQSNFLKLKSKPISNAHNFQKISILQNVLQN